MHDRKHVGSSQGPAGGTHIPPLAADAMGCMPLLAEATTADAAWEEEEDAFDAGDEVELLEPETLPEPPTLPVPPAPPFPPLPGPALLPLAALSPSASSLPVAQLVATPPATRTAPRTRTSSM